jgi:tetratricopeptide (TPR) repeat protein
MLTLAEEHLDASRQAQALNQLWICASRNGQYAEVLEISQRAEQVARLVNPPDNALLAQVIWQKAIVFQHIGRMTEGLHYGAESLALSQQAQAQPQIASNYNLLGLINISNGNYAHAIEFMHKSLAIWQELRHRQFESDLLSNIGEAHRLSGDYTRAFQHFQQSLQITRQIGSLANLPLLYTNMAHAKLGLNDPQAALELLQKAMEYINGRKSLVAETQILLAETQLCLGHKEEAQQAIQDAFRIYGGTMQVEEEGTAWRVLGEILSAGETPLTVTFKEKTMSILATDAFAQSEYLFRQSAEQRNLAYTLWKWSSHENNSGNQQKSAALWQAAHQIFETIGLKNFLEKMEQETRG